MFHHKSLMRKEWQNKIQITSWNKRCPRGNKSGVFLNHAMPIKNGAANINLIPVANTGGIVSAAIRIASHVVPQVSETSRNNTNIVTLRIRYSQ